MKVTEWLDKVAYLDSMELIEGDVSRVYKSKFDNSYITHVGMEDSVKYLADKGITDELTHGVGFSPKDNKWYGWSHRAIYGFDIGSECKKGDCHYFGDSLNAQKEDAVRFWSNKHCENVRCVGIIRKDGDEFFAINWDYLDTVPNKKLHGTTGKTQHYITHLGRGEWIAKTIDDAKQMAIDFNKGVS